MKRGSGCCAVDIYCTAASTSFSDSISYITYLFSEWRITISGPWWSTDFDRLKSRRNKNPVSWWSEVDKPVNHIESRPKYLPCLYRNFEPIFVWEYTKTGKSILRPAFDQSNRKAAGPAPILIKCHIINSKYDPPFNQSNYEKASPYQLPLIIIRWWCSLTFLLTMCETMSTWNCYTGCLKKRYRKL